VPDGTVEKSTGRELDFKDNPDEIRQRYFTRESIFYLTRVFYITKIDSSISIRRLIYDSVTRCRRNKH
jgi:hypothetical protein